MRTTTIAGGQGAVREVCDWLLARAESALNRRLLLPRARCVAGAAAWRSCSGQSGRTPPSARTAVPEEQPGHGLRLRATDVLVEQTDAGGQLQYSLRRAQVEQAPRRRPDRRERPHAALRTARQHGPRHRRPPLDGDAPTAASCRKRPVACSNSRAMSSVRAQLTGAAAAHHRAHRRPLLRHGRTALQSEIRRDSSCGAGSRCSGRGLKADIRAGTLALNQQSMPAFRPDIAAARPARRCSRASDGRSGRSRRSRERSRHHRRCCWLSDRLRGEPAANAERRDPAGLAAGPMLIRATRRSRARASSRASDNTEWEFRGAVHIEFDGGELDADRATAKFVGNRSRRARRHGFARARSRTSSRARAQRNSGRANSIEYRREEGPRAAGRQGLVHRRPQRIHHRGHRLQPGEPRDRERAAAGAEGNRVRMRIRGAGRDRDAGKTDAPLRHEQPRPPCARVHLRKSYRGRCVVEDLSPAGRLRRDRRPARTERRRQDHRLLHDRRPGLRRLRARIELGETDLTLLPMHRRAQIGARLPAAGSLGVPPPDASRAEHPGDPRDARAISTPPARAAASGGDPRRTAHRPRARQRRAWRCPAASGGAWKSPARWRPHRASSCSTSRSPASIRCR